MDRDGFGYVGACVALATSLGVAFGLAGNPGLLADLVGRVWWFFDEGPAPLALFIAQLCCLAVAVDAERRYVERRDAASFRRRRRDALLGVIVAGAAGILLTMYRCTAG